MKETGLMFKAPLVRAILSGQKTQTRRVVKPQPAPGQGMVNAAYCGDRHLWLRDGPCDESDPAYEWRCPFGKPGDRIYVRETWRQQADDDGFLIDNAFWYRATDPDVMDSEDMEKSPWGPSIHMPKSAARIWLEVTGVRVERLQSISEADAKAEGVDASKYHGLDRAYARAFSELWESTGGDWAANPWVWVVDFKRIEKP